MSELKLGLLDFKNKGNFGRGGVSRLANHAEQVEKIKSIFVAGLEVNKTALTSFEYNAFPVIGQQVIENVARYFDISHLAGLIYSGTVGVVEDLFISAGVIAKRQQKRLVVFVEKAYYDRISIICKNLDIFCIEGLPSKKRGIGTDEYAVVYAVPTGSNPVGYNIPIKKFKKLKKMGCYIILDQAYWFIDGAELIKEYFDILLFPTSKLLGAESQGVAYGKTGDPVWDNFMARMQNKTLIFPKGLAELYFLNYLFTDGQGQLAESMETANDYFRARKLLIHQLAAENSFETNLSFESNKGFFVGIELSKRIVEKLKFFGLKVSTYMHRKKMYLRVATSIHDLSDIENLFEVLKWAREEIEEEDRKAKLIKAKALEFGIETITEDDRSITLVFVKGSFSFKFLRKKTIVAPTKIDQEGFVGLGIHLSVSDDEINKFFDTLETGQKKEAQFTALMAFLHTLDSNHTFLKHNLDALEKQFMEGDIVGIAPIFKANEGSKLDYFLRKPTLLDLLNSTDHSSTEDLLGSDLHEVSLDSETLFFTSLKKAICEGLVIMDANDEALSAKLFAILLNQK